MPRPSVRARLATPARRARIAALLLAVTLAPAGCAPAAVPDPALVSMAADALSASASARLGIGLDQESRIFATTFAALLDDMAANLADTERELVLAPTPTPADAEYRAAALDATRDALEAVHAAQQGHVDDARDELEAAVAELDALEGVG